MGGLVDNKKKSKVRKWEWNHFQGLLFDQTSLSIELHSAECSRSSPYRSKMASHDLTYKGKNMHICSECKKSFDRAGILKMHMLTHSKERGYTCVQCDKSFVQAGNLKRHTLTHSGEKPHKCTQCDYASSLAVNLRYHIKTHSLEKPNQCKWCDYSSSQILPGMYSPTVERSRINVTSVGAHSTKQELSKPTSASTLVKSHLNARNVVSPVLENLLWSNIWPGIQQKMTSAFLQCDDNLNLKQ